MSHKQKAFVILTPGFAACEQDTTCLPMQQSFVRAMAKLYPHLDIIILSFQYPFRESTYKWGDATVVSFNGRNRGGVTRLLLRRKINAALKKIDQNKQVVGFLSFWLGECAFVGKKFGRRKKLPHYCWILGQDAKKKNPYSKRIAAQSGDLIALSDFLQGEFYRNHRVKPFAVITPGIEIESANECERDIDLIAVGSLIPLKQFDVFVEMVSKLKKEFPFIKALLVGEGPELDTLKQLSGTLGVQEHIHFTGLLSHNDVLKKMQRAKVLVHPSCYEGFSGVCLEALSRGTHVVSFCRAMEKNFEQWHIVTSRDEMVRKVTNLLKQESLVYKKLAFQTMEDTAKQMMNLFLNQT
jgi:glycosyltransferase involved in cell wall biosynthesis